MAAASRSMPVMAATRADRSSASSRWPDTPALRRCTETTSATVAATATPMALSSRTHTVSTHRNPVTAAATAKSP